MSSLRKCLVALALTAGVISPAFSSAAAAAPSNAAPTTAAVLPSLGSPLSAVASDLHDLLEFTPGYVGVRLTPENLIEVFAVKGGDLGPQARLLLSGVPSLVTELQAPSWSTLADARDALTSDLAALRQLDVEPVMWGPDPESGKLRVEVHELTDRKAEALRSRYKVPMLIVDGRLPADSKRDTRGNDSAPWNAGTRTAMDNGGQCTTGPTVVSRTSGRPYLLTSGHCYGDGRANKPWVNGAFNFRSINAGTVMGGTNAEFEDGGYDLALIDAPASNLVWRTSHVNAEGSRGTQARAINGVVGTLTCVSGSYSGERCGARVQYFDQTFNNGGIVTVHTNSADSRTSANPTGTALAGPGDSGAATYEVHSDGLYMHGLYYDHAGSMACPNNNIEDRQNNCGPHIYMINLPHVLSHRGVNLKTY